MLARRYEVGLEADILPKPLSTDIPCVLCRDGAFVALRSSHMQ